MNYCTTTSSVTLPRRASSTTPITSLHGRAEPPTLKHLPMGSAPGQQSWAIVSFTTATRCAPALSVEARARPRRTAVPIVWKYSGVTAATYGPPLVTLGRESKPGTDRLTAYLHLKGIPIDRLAAVTPGSARTR